MPTPRRKQSNSLFKRLLLASSVCTVLCIAGIQAYLLLRNYISLSRGQGPAPVFRNSGPAADDAVERSVELIYVRPATTAQERPAITSHHTRISRWHVPISTRNAAGKAAGRLSVNPQVHAGAEEREREYDALVQSLRSSGHIGNGRHTPATRQRTVQDLPQLRLSSKLAHAAELGLHQASNGYQLTGGIKPKTTLSKDHLTLLKRIRGGSSNIWQ
eukprot:jgi/Ulvmu1/7674/UM038_0104.1